MGLSISKLFDWVKGSREARIVMVGLDAAGKTTILYKLRLGEVITTIPTIGFNVDTIEYKNLNMTVWDIGGQTKIRPLWRYYYQDTDAIIYVVDSSDADRFAESREELHSMLQDDMLRDAKLLVFANKQDAPNACKVSDIANKLQLNDIKNRQWFVQGTCAINGEGLLEGLDWLSTEMRKERA